MTTNADLHCHTTASDGTLSPLQLYHRARDKGVEMLAITDHDSVEAHRFLSSQKLDGPQLITGMELSTTWSGVEIHVVGLNFPLDHPDLSTVIETQNTARKNRSVHIAGKLVKQLKLPLSREALYQEIVELALGRQKQNDDGFTLSETSIQTGRPHFAAWLTDKGYCKDANDAFNRYLGNRQLGNLRAFWPAMSQGVAWIRALGGSAVLAHPAKYKMTRTKLRALVKDFKIAGGHALEVTGSIQPPGQAESLAKLCLDFDLKASRGSDFHSPHNQWVEIGKLAPLPSGLTPVWDKWVA
ncbi:MAG: PHP domain-containing protein [Endozoicomonas sp.]